MPPNSNESIQSDRFREEIARLPKAELHVHIDGSLRPRTMIEIAASEGIELPATDPEQLADYMVARDVADLVGYLRRFDVTLSVMQTPEALERIGYELAEDLASENVAYAELRFCPFLNTRRGLEMHEVVEATLKGMVRAERDHGIRTRLILCALRHLDPRISLDVAEVAAAYVGRGVVGFDLAGAEAGNPPSVHREAFERVKRAGLPLTIHAGEAAGPQSIAEAIQLCGATRIGHGTRLHEDLSLLEYVRDARITLEVCLSSNVQTGVAASIKAHPLRMYFEAGVPVTINTDNRLVSGTTLTDEYLLAHRELGFSAEELEEINREGFAAAFEASFDLPILRRKS